MNSAIAHFARLQETIPHLELILIHAVFPVLRHPVLRPLASHYALTLFPAVFPVLRLNAMPCPALRPSASQCAPSLKARRTLSTFDFVAKLCPVYSVVQASADAKLC